MDTGQRSGVGPILNAGHSLLAGQDRHVDMQYIFADPKLVTMFRFLVKTRFFLVT